MFEKSKKWFKQGLWTETMVQNAVNRGVLTEVQMAEILATKGE